MKKLFYSVVLFTIVVVTASSCIKEEVKPIKETNNTGGGVSDKF